MTSDSIKSVIYKASWNEDSRLFQSEWKIFASDRIQVNTWIINGQSEDSCIKNMKDFTDPININWFIFVFWFGLIKDNSLETGLEKGNIINADNDISRERQYATLFILSNKVWSRLFHKLYDIVSLMGMRCGWKNWPQGSLFGMFRLAKWCRTEIPNSDPESRIFLSTRHTHVQSFFAFVSMYYV